MKSIDVTIRKVENGMIISGNGKTWVVNNGSRYLTDSVETIITREILPMLEDDEPAAEDTIAKAA